jgi:hypothetical protein
MRTYGGLRPRSVEFTANEFAVTLRAAGAARRYAGCAARSRRWGKRSLSSEPK